jgi:hypothetical protein
VTVSSPNVTEIKLDRLIDDMRLLRSQMFAFDRQLKGIEACLKQSEPSEQQSSKSRPSLAATATAAARTVLTLVASGQQPAQPCITWERDPDRVITDPFRHLHGQVFCIASTASTRKSSFIRSGCASMYVTATRAL